MIAPGVMILHEKAHAWAAFALSEECTARFKELRGWVY